MKRLRLILAFIGVLNISAQEKDSLDFKFGEINGLEEVVVTGQINPQSVNKSVFEVKVINRETIDRLAANNLADILNQQLNINIIPNASTGKSGVQLFGLDSQYFKILVDNIPLISDEGLGNNADLTQINLDDIERIEIVEGSMGVQYGANAVSGIINIITKKDAQSEWQITPYVQEETIGDEYNFEDEGRHIQSVKVAHNINDNWFAQISATRNDFKGRFGEKQGQNYQQNDGLRGYEWLPKLQNNYKALVRFKSKNTTAFYKLEWFDERVKRYSESVRLNENSSTGTINPTASDDIFKSGRMFHHFNLNTKLFEKTNLNISTSFQEQKRDVEEFTYRIKTGEKLNIRKNEFESRQAIFSRGNLSNLLNFEKFDLQVGYELNLIDGFASPMSNPLQSDPVDRKLNNYDVFATSKYQFSDKFSIRPGVRALFSNQFDPLMAVSLSSKYLFNDGVEARAVVGSSPRTPSYDELFTYFVDVNHDVRGNENLKPEQGFSTFIHFKKTFWSDDYKLKIKPKLSFWYLNVSDRIELTIVNPSPLAYQFSNIDKFQSIGTSMTTSLEYKNISGNIGLSLTGVSKVLDSQDNFNDDFLYGLQANSNISYRIPKWGLTSSVFFKYNGPQYQFVQQQNEADETVLTRGKQDGFGLMDASFRKRLIKNKLDLTFGIRNVLDVDRVNTTAVEGGAHDAAPSSLLLAYGRSYFIKLLYQFKF
ncbi:TonB-dependent receptor plug domain-containing protein [Psychroflexus aestuariivivens]|uniref:TonB-dependent receptor plug domain-containing protein n=1 Tax=Psychroflexus aestuariivivens TaxID=1795040 RepID=UPI000FDBFBB4|nr:TonB-dependent receptor [Psychroflexus aestuariivivens]